MGDTKILALVLLVVFSAFIFQWAYFSSVEEGEIKWVDDIDPGDTKIEIEEKQAEVGISEVGMGIHIKEAEPVEAPPWYEVWRSIPYAFGKLGQSAKEIGGKILSPFQGMWDWVERTHIFDIFTFQIWKNIDTDIPKGIQYIFSLLMGIIIYAIPAYLIVRLIRGGG